MGSLKTIKDALDEVFGEALVMTGSMAAWEAGPQRKYISGVRRALNRALSQVPDSALDEMARSLDAAECKRDVKVAELAKDDPDAYVDDEPSGGPYHGE